MAGLRAPALCGLCVLWLFQATADSDPCAGQEWEQVRQLLWVVAGDGRDGHIRLRSLKESQPLPPMRPSACVHGAVCLHLLHMLRTEREERIRELSGIGGEVVTVLMDGPFSKIGASRWPLFALLHLAQVQLEGEEALSSDAAAQRRWQPLVTDDHVRFRNWVHGHLVHGQTPPLVDSVHFLARADPREPAQPSSLCSAAKAVGYLASALVLAQEKDEQIRKEAEHLVVSAEGHIKHCENLEPESFNLLALLRTEWPIWWLLHSVLSYLFPWQATARPAAASPPLASETLPPKVEATVRDVRQPGPAEMSASSRETPQCAGLENRPPSLCSLPKAVFVQYDGAVYLVDTPQLEKQGMPSASLMQLFRNGRPLRRRAAAAALCEAPGAGGRSQEDVAGFSESRLFGRRLLAVQDPDLQGAAYSASWAPASVGLYVEETSASDPYNAEWLQAYITAFGRLGLEPHVISNSEEAQAGVLYFWRINQMFGGGRLAGAPGVGLAVAQHLGALTSRGAAPWPRPETMQLYQDKIALRELFARVGVPAPKSWVVASVADLEKLLSEGQLKEADFPLVLKHPYAASSRGMRSCASMADSSRVLAQWLQEHQVPCLLQRRLAISRDMRVTYVGGEIIQGYWRVKADSEDLSSGSAAGSRLDFAIPREAIAPFVRSFAEATGIDIGGMDIAFPEGSDSEGPVVFEVSPIFDLNPEPPEEWRSVPYREYKQTADYKARRAENYAQCAQKVVEHGLHRRGKLFVDIDNTVSDAWNRIRRATIPSWPGETFDSRAHLPEELAKDLPLPGAQKALASLTREWEITYLSARGAPGAFDATLRWLAANGFPNPGRLLLVESAVDKIAWLQDASSLDPHRRPVLLVDDLTRGHHLAQAVPDETMRSALQALRLEHEVFDPQTSDWAKLAERLLARAAEMRVTRSRPAAPVVLCRD
ncbi:hypothetical protein AK812_SmicGene9511 [Symbiodinium microadriaticum]|uniref:ATP-grasp domain-containing protein n=1 Tax=Symbiodinium microadriaticum TaxID=2951 RepID=A0A1Q9EIA0_SYMMI|nr:hypothetical protein AK812_SmicGene9511 [Symbiodinium microadriaticum]